MRQVYKHEVGMSHKGWPSDWRFYWDVDNQSGRTSTQIAYDIASALEGVLGWFSNLREFWPVGSKCQAYRIRQVFPDLRPWTDMYWQFADYGGRFFIGYGDAQAKINCHWVCTSDRVHRARTELSYYPADAIVDDELQDIWREITENFCELHIGPHVTAYGDIFRPAIFSVDGQYYPVFAFWVDTRVTFRRKRRR